MAVPHVAHVRSTWHSAPDKDRVQVVASIDGGFIERQVRELMNTVFTRMVRDLTPA